MVTMPTKKELEEDPEAQPVVEYTRDLVSEHLVSIPKVKFKHVVRAYIHSLYASNIVHVINEKETICETLNTIIYIMYRNLKMLLSNLW